MNEIILIESNTSPDRLAKLERLAQTAEQVSANRRSINTLRGYQADWEDFCSWCDEHGFQSLPTAPHTVKAYLADRAINPWVGVSGRLRKPKILVVRRVVGNSMLPTLKPGQVVIGVKSKAATGRLVIAVHKDSEIIKRLTKIDGNKVYIVGDNSAASSDSRNFGWINKDQLLDSVIWPRNL